MMVVYLNIVEFLDEKRQKLKNKNGNDLFKKPIIVNSQKNSLNLSVHSNGIHLTVRMFTLIQIIFIKKMEEPTCLDLEVH